MHSVMHAYMTLRTACVSAVRLLCQTPGQPMHGVRIPRTPHCLSGAIKHWAPFVRQSHENVRRRYAGILVTLNILVRLLCS